MPPHERLGSDDMKDLEDGWKQSIELDEDPPIEVGQTNPAPALTAQHEQLVPQDRILGLKPRVRSTRRDQDGQYRPEEPDHPISLRIRPLPQPNELFGTDNLDAARCDAGDWQTDRDLLTRKS
jgi:hypothetical protein